MTDTDTDYIAISVIFNIILVFHNWLMHKRYEALTLLFGKTVGLVAAIADGKVMPKRDSNGDIRIKDVDNEKDKSRTQTN